jgi:hypothetical protein
MMIFLSVVGILAFIAVGCFIAFAIGAYQSNPPQAFMVVLFVWIVLGLITGGFYLGHDDTHNAQMADSDNHLPADETNGSFDNSGWTDSAGTYHAPKEPKGFFESYPRIMNFVGAIVIYGILVRGGGSISVLSANYNLTGAVTSTTRTFIPARILPSAGRPSIMFGMVGGMGLLIWLALWYGVFTRGTSGEGLGQLFGACIDILLRTLSWLLHGCPSKI